MPSHYPTQQEKLILVDPTAHVWGAYNVSGKLIRWGIATAGAPHCQDSNASCLTAPGSYRIYSLGSESCYSKKYHNAPMPYCMFFNGSEALHGSSNIQFANASHGCVRVHIDDAKWLRYHFVEGPNQHNHHQGTRIIVKSYHASWEASLSDHWRKYIANFMHANTKFLSYVTKRMRFALA